MLKQFLKARQDKGRTGSTIASLELTLLKAEEWIGKPLEKASYEEIMRFIDELRKNGSPTKDEFVGRKKRALSNNSIYIAESKLLQFFRFCYNETESDKDEARYQKMIKRLKNIRVDKSDSDIQAKDILLPEEVKKLINVATLERDRCIIACLFESGMRLGEFLALSRDMVESNEKTQEVTFHIPNIEGCKTGARSVLCLEVYGYVQDWLKCNPSTMFMPMSRNGIRRVLRVLYDRAGIKKPCYPHMLRHSSITNACVMKMQPNQISMRYWGIPDSGMLDTYLHMSQEMVSSGYRDVKGMGNGNGNTVINPLAVRCVNCGRLIQTGSLCKTCDDAKKLGKENEALKAEMETMKAMFNEDAIKAMIEARVAELMKKG